MSLYFGLCVLFVSICGTVSAMVNGNERDIPLNRGNGITEFSLTERKKRALPGIIVGLLRDAKILFTSDRYNMFLKHGGYNRALMDFLSTKPFHVRDIGLTKWGRTRDGNIIVSGNKRDPEGTLTIWKSDPNTGEVIIDRIRYIE